MSGKVDAVRLPKELFYAHQVVGSPTPAIHIIGHWTYPAGTKKTIYVVANTPSVELSERRLGRGHDQGGWLQQRGRRGRHAYDRDRGGAGGAEAHADGRAAGLPG